MSAFGECQVGAPFRSLCAAAVAAARYNGVNATNLHQREELELHLAAAQAEIREHLSTIDDLRLELGEQRIQSADLAEASPSEHSITPPVAHARTTSRLLAPRKRKIPPLSSLPLALQDALMQEKLDVEARAIAAERAANEERLNASSAAAALTDMTAVVEEQKKMISSLQQELSSSRQENAELSTSLETAQWEMEVQRNAARSAARASDATLRRVQAMSKQIEELTAANVLAQQRQQNDDASLASAHRSIDQVRASLLQSNSEKSSLNKELEALRSQHEALRASLAATAESAAGDSNSTAVPTAPVVSEDLHDSCLKSIELPQLVGLLVLGLASAAFYGTDPGEFCAAVQKLPTLLRDKFIGEAPQLQRSSFCVTESRTKASMDDDMYSVLKTLIASNLVGGEAAAVLRTLQRMCEHSNGNVQNAMLLERVSQLQKEVSELTERNAFTDALRAQVTELSILLGERSDAVMALESEVSLLRRKLELVADTDTSLGVVGTLSTSLTKANDEAMAVAMAALARSSSADIVRAHRSVPADARSPPSDKKDRKEAATEEVRPEAPVVVDTVWDRMRALQDKFRHPGPAGHTQPPSPALSRDGSLATPTSHRSVSPGAARPKMQRSRSTADNMDILARVGHLAKSDSLVINHFGDVEVDTDFVSDNASLRRSLQHLESEFRDVSNRNASMEESLSEFQEVMQAAECDHKAVVAALRRAEADISKLAGVIKKQASEFFSARSEEQSRHSQLQEGLVDMISQMRAAVSKTHASHSRGSSRRASKANDIGHSSLAMPRSPSSSSAVDVAKSLEGVIESAEARLHALLEANRQRNPVPPPIELSDLPIPADYINLSQSASLEGATMPVVSVEHVMDSKSAPSLTLLEAAVQTDERQHGEEANTQTDRVLCIDADVQASLSSAGEYDYDDSDVGETAQGPRDTLAKSEAMSSVPITEEASKKPTGKLAPKRQTKPSMRTPNPTTGTSNSTKATLRKPVQPPNKRRTKKPAASIALVSDALESTDSDVEPGELTQPVQQPPAVASEASQPPESKSLHHGDLPQIGRFATSPTAASTLSESFSVPTENRTPAAHAPRKVTVTAGRRAWAGQETTSVASQTDWSWALPTSSKPSKAKAAKPNGEPRFPKLWSAQLPGKHRLWGFARFMRIMSKLLGDLEEANKATNAMHTQIGALQDELRAAKDHTCYADDLMPISTSFGSSSERGVEIMKKRMVESANEIALLHIRLQEQDIQLKEMDQLRVELNQTRLLPSELEKELQQTKHALDQSEKNREEEAAKQMTLRRLIYDLEKELKFLHLRLRSDSSAYEKVAVDALRVNRAHCQDLIKLHKQVKTFRSLFENVRSSAVLRNIGKRDNDVHQSVDGIIQSMRHLRESVKCVLCSAMMVKPVIAVPCGHIFCEACLIRANRKDGVYLPLRDEYELAPSAGVWESDMEKPDSHVSALFLEDKDAEAESAMRRRPPLSACGGDQATFSNDVDSSNFERIKNVMMSADHIDAGGVVRLVGSRVAPSSVVDFSRMTDLMYCPCCRARNTRLYVRMGTLDHVCDHLQQGAVPLARLQAVGNERPYKTLANYIRTQYRDSDARKRADGGADEVPDSLNFLDTISMDTSAPASLSLGLSVLPPISANDSRDSSILESLRQSILAQLEEASKKQEECCENDDIDRDDPLLPKGSMRVAPATRPSQISEAARRMLDDTFGKMHPSEFGVVYEADSASDGDSDCLSNPTPAEPDLDGNPSGMGLGSHHVPIPSQSAVLETGDREDYVAFADTVFMAPDLID